MNKKNKTALSVLLALLIVMSSMWSGLSVISFATFEYELEAGNSVKVTASDERSYIRIEPEQTCRYMLEGLYLYSFEYGVLLLNENKEIIKDLSYMIGISDGYITLDLSAGKTYYIGVDFISDYYEDNTLTFKLHSTEGEISENETKTFGVGGFCIYVKFVPEKSGYYEVSYETADTAVDINLCDADKDHIKFVGGDSENSKRDFYLTGGETYYFELENSDNRIDKISLGVKENINGISAGETKQIKLYGRNEEKLIFIPQKSGIYKFYSVTSNGDYFTRLTDKYNLSDEYSYPLEEGGFELICEIYEDNTYYFYVCNNSPLSDDETCILDVTLECIEEICNHKNHKYDEGKEATCTENGYTDGYYCYDCENWYSGHTAVWDLHCDENEDTICDDCGNEMPVSTGACGGYYNENYWSSDGSAGYALYADGTLEIMGEGYIDPDIFWYRNNIKNVIIQDGITKISGAAFCGSSIEKVIIPASVTDIGYEAFYTCSLLSEITVDEENQVFSSIDGVLFNKDKTKIIKFPSAKTDSTYEIPDNVVYIGRDAFSYCYNLESVVIPESVIEIEVSAFDICSNLTDVYYNGTEEQWKNVTVGFYNENLLNATIHFLDSTCAHENKTEYPRQDATCTTSGYTAGVYCPDCEQWLSGHDVIEATHVPVTHTQNASCGVNGYKLTTCSLCGETLDYVVIPAGEHKWSYWTKTKETTCTTDGEESRNCSLCGENETRVVVSLGHKWSSWKVTEATLISAGEKSRTCSVCKETEKEVLAKLEGKIAEDALSGIKIEYADNSYIGDKISVSVEEDFTGSQYLTMSYGNFVSWNIKTYVNGVVSQPNAPVLVSIPIPSEFNKDMIVVYHIDSTSSKLEKIEPVIIEGNSIKFLASSFSIYMVIDESSAIEKDTSENCNCNCHKSGFMGVIWKILRFFYKLFKIKPICECGVSHY